MDDYDEAIRVMLVETEQKMMEVLKKGPYTEKRAEYLQLIAKLKNRIQSVHLQTFLRLCGELGEAERDAAMLAGLSVGLRLNQIATAQAEDFIIKTSECHLE